MNVRIILLSALLFCSVKSFAQKKSKDNQVDPDSSGVVETRLLPTTLPLLVFDEKDKKTKKLKSKKKKNKKVFFGIKAKKGQIKSVFRDSRTIIIYHYSDQKENKDPYIRDIYWMDTKEKIIKKSDFDGSKGHLLHGPYEKMVNEILVEKGMFYLGKKHGTWMSFDNKNVLQDKLHYSKGWPKNSRVTYYNRAKNEIEQLTPIEYDLKEGNFYHFYENGQIAVEGEYHFGEKIGIWTEYWDLMNTKFIKKREIQYQEKPFSKNFTPFIRAEWDKAGNLIYRKE
jgi:antitoxin component YwqK of YwqJK toxin-antitoxin module